jgi:uncharacterized protein (TIRG00374 family)
VDEPRSFTEPAKIAGAAPDPEGLAPEVLPPAPAGRWLRAGWVASLLVVGLLVVVAARLADERELADLVRRARPAWLLVALLPQALTYLCAAGVWQRALARAGHRRRLVELVPLGLAKLFTDQAVPSLGLAGGLLVARALARRGVPREVAAAALLVEVVAYRVAYGLALGAALAVLAARGHLSAGQRAVAALFAVLALLLPLLVVGSRRQLRRLPRRWRARPRMGRALAAIQEAPAELMRDRALLAQASALELGVFALDAATLGLMLLAVGARPDPMLVLTGFVMASVAGSLAVVPGGLGVFEGAGTAALHLLGVPIAAALSATLLLRAFTFWLPMLPGLWIARREAARGLGAARRRPAEPHAG